MLEKDDEKMYLTESDKRELMLEIEELAQLEGLRSYAKLGSEYSISAETQTLINGKADKTEIIKHDGSVSLTEDWDVGNGRTIKIDKIMARDSDGLALFDDGSSGIFIKDGGYVGIGTVTPNRSLEIRNDNVGLLTTLALYNANVTDNNGVVVSYRTDTDGIGGASFVEMAGFRVRFEEHDHAARKANFQWFTISGGTYNWMHFSYNGNLGVGTLTPSAKLAINGGLHVGGDSDPGDNNLLIDGNTELDGDLNHDGSNIGFFGVSPVTRQSTLASQLTTITCSSPGTPDYAINNPVNTNAYGWTTADEFKTVMSVIANLQTRLGELETKLRNYGLLQ